MNELNKIYSELKIAMYANCNITKQVKTRRACVYILWSHTMYVHQYLWLYTIIILVPCFWSLVIFLNHQSQIELLCMTWYVQHVNCLETTWLQKKLLYLVHLKHFETVWNYVVCRDTLPLQIKFHQIQNIWTGKRDGEKTSKNNRKNM